MKRLPIHTVVTVALISAAACASTPTFAAGKCDSPNGIIEQRACANAAEGPEALRRFVERTRAIYGLYYFDYARNDPSAVAPAMQRVAITSKTP